MIFSERSGVLFTADPISGNRNIAVIDAGFGLGEALVSGLITPDTFHIQKKKMLIIEQKINPKKKGIFPKFHGESGVEIKDLSEIQQQNASISET